MNSVKLQDTNQHTKSVVFLYTNNKLSGKEIKKTIPFKWHQKEKKILRNKFEQGSKRTIRWKLQNTDEKFEETQINWNTSHVHELEELMLQTTKSYPEIQCNSYQNSSGTFTEIEKKRKTILKFM